MRRKLAIIHTELKMGGISKSLINLLNSEYIKKFDIDVYLLNSDCDFDEIDFSNNVYIKYISIPIWKQKIIKYIPFKLFMNIYVEPYDFVVDFNGFNNICANFALNLKANKHIIWIHNDYNKRYLYSFKFKILWHLMKWKYQYYDEFVSVSKGAAIGFQKIYRNFEKQILVIPNLIDVEDLLKKSKERVNLKVKDTYNLISVGNLVKAKNVGRQIDIIEDVIKNRKDVVLYILGDGHEAKKLQEKVRRKKLTNHIFFLGRKTNPYAYMNKMDGLLFTSLYEGQGIVVREAQVLDLDLYVEDSLKDYNEGVATSKDIVEAILCAKKKQNRKINKLVEYHKNINNRIRDLFEGCK